MRTTMAWNNQLAIAMPKKAFVGDFSPGFMVRLARKDVRLALTLADQAGVQADLGRAALAVLDRAVEAGMGAQDSAALLRLREQEAGVEVRLAANTGRG
jgi:3-hydroxyisobutyrate dehydrogenase-like beta-hydroxyacid dehydrogenase